WPADVADGVTTVRLVSLATLSDVPFVPPIETDVAPEHPPPDELN
ncbi:MAG: hypothetical protein RLY45_1727, partial [Actinomycetota bacterium]